MRGRKHCEGNTVVYVADLGGLLRAQLGNQAGLRLPGLRIPDEQEDQLFGFGEKTGALGVDRTWLYGPEVGVLGIVLSGAFAWWLWRKTLPAS